MTPRKAKPAFAGRSIPAMRKEARVSPCPVCGASEAARPVWKFGALDMDGPWGWRKLGSAELDQFRQRLSAFESMTWHEVEKAGSHYIPCNQLEKTARERLEEIRQDDIDQLYSLRFTGKLRVWGIRDGAALSFLWYDSEHEVYPVEKRNT